MVYELVAKDYILFSFLLFMSVLVIFILLMIASISKKLKELDNTSKHIFLQLKTLNEITKED